MRGDLCVCAMRHTIKEEILALLGMIQHSDYFRGMQLTQKLSELS